MVSSGADLHSYIYKKIVNMLSQLLKMALCRKTSSKYVNVEKKDRNKAILPLRQICLLRLFGLVRLFLG